MLRCDGSHLSSQWYPPCCPLSVQPTSFKRKAYQMGFSLNARRQTNSNVPCRDSAPVRNHTPKTKTVPLFYQLFKRVTDLKQRLTSNFVPLFNCIIVFFFPSFWTSQLLSFAPGWSRHWWPLAAHQTWGQRGERMDGRMLDRGQAGMEGVGRSPPPQYVCGSQAKKRCCSPEGRVSLPESLWHLLQVLVSVGFKLHILNGGQSHKNTPNIMQYVAAKSG